MCIHTKLIELQTGLKVPKGQKNTFGNYNYRSCEDIVEAVKAKLPKDTAIILTDEMVCMGDRFYVKATARLFDKEGSIEAHGYAREALTKKGMDESQITGAASSYARKYALNGLFAIDDTKDADTDEHQEAINNAPKPEPKQEKPELTPAQQKTKAQIEAIKTEIKAAELPEHVTEVVNKHIAEINKLSQDQQDHINKFAAKERDKKIQQPMAAE